MPKRQKTPSAAQAEIDRQRGWSIGAAFTIPLFFLSMARDLRTSLPVARVCLAWTWAAYNRWKSSIGLAALGGFPFVFFLLATPRSADRRATVHRRRLESGATVQREWIPDRLVRGQPTCIASWCCSALSSILQKWARMSISRRQPSF